MIQILNHLGVLAGFASISLALPSSSLVRRATNFLDTMGFYNVSVNNGSWLTFAPQSGGLGEPINVVVGAKSDPSILTVEGLTDWFWSVQFSEEFLGQSLGVRQGADLGDGRGYVNQSAILRYNYFDQYYGTLRESIEGGSHARYWHQNGSLADSGAWFISASEELPASENHMITPNGYDIGRNYLVGNATQSNGTISPITNNTYSAAMEMVQFLPANSSEGVNHGIETDGRVAILTVRVTRNVTAETAMSSASRLFDPSQSTGFVTLASAIFALFALSLLQ